MRIELRPDGFPAAMDTARAVHVDGVVAEEASEAVGI